MTLTLAWLIFVLGAAHIGYAVIKFRVPLLEGVSAGVIGQFSTPEIRRTAFWFTMFGPLVMLAGQVAIHAAASGDLDLYCLVGLNLLAVTGVGVIVIPKSPFLVGMLISAAMLAAGYGLI